MPLLAPEAAAHGDEQPSRTRATASIYAYALFSNTRQT